MRMQNRKSGRAPLVHDPFRYNARRQIQLFLHNYYVTAAVSGICGFVPHSGHCFFNKVLYVIK